jgi:hypothetical protein
MRLIVPTDADGALIVHGLLNSMVTLPVQRGEDGCFFIDGVSGHHYAGLLTGSRGVAWERANPRT